MVKCPTCGAEIIYIPVGYTQSDVGVVMVESEYTEIINDSGRVVRGHIRHQCQQEKRRCGTVELNR